MTIPAPASGPTATTPTSTASTPAASRVRAIAPDLARGLMLLMIALANMPFHLYGRDVAMSSMHFDGGDLGDRIWQAIAIIAIDGRSYPLFAFLFGYGMWQLYRRQLAAGATSLEARRLLRRRHWWMLAFGAVHAALLWGGDIIGAYGLVGLLVGWLFVERRDRTIVIWASVLGGLLALGALAWMAMGLVATLFGVTDLGDVSLPAVAGIDSYLASILARLGMWAPVTFVQGVFGLAVPVAILLAILAARHGMLEEPERHRALLAKVAVGGIAIAWSAGILAFLEHVDVIPVMPTTFWMLHTAAGVAGGLGYAALFGLVAARLAQRPLGPVSKALTAVGKRSMTSYLLQSVLFAPVLSAWGLGLGGVLTEWQGALYALGVWLVTVAVAVALDAAGRRGPAETLLRRLAYPRDAKAQPTAMRDAAAPSASSAPVPTVRG
ncbi:DUF418 domain-containing protein [Agrococcus jejuensis]|uniref:DUF418 domain-containing protein n=1 Tax=Agrococcus jejuensis TaxID=399736 RepID=UPI001E61E49C|nr:DUF418 domain-containing protein [Agrococcus jejuensis]